MEAIVVTEFGSAEQMRWKTKPDPVPGPGQVRIAVEASGIHRVDLEVRAGHRLGTFPLPDLPYVPGREVAGTVDQVGNDVDRHLLGIRVAVSLGNANGGYARFALAPDVDLHPIDPALDAGIAVAMVGTGRTALGLLANAQLSAADTVLITGAAGGLGVLFVQAAHRLGATVIAVSGGAEKTTLTTTLGADLSVDHNQPDWLEQIRRHRPTVLLDGSGGTIGAAAVHVLAPHARALFFGHPTGVSDAELAQLGIASTMALGGFTPEKNRTWAAEALAEAAAGELIPQITRFPLADAAHAHIEFDARRTLGKVVLI
ncbi:alcohol dehydrogenase catalytic domain-containing protein [Antrihabitans cavernicola]|uniref:Zinc-binding dehydrogenase n=1 Tax=Antrihabitans cavernicola TaxID=2495913 RepID=A0A5A7S0L5_9NOCA|nr:zinc-binding dehydrogenase [Spelaeibacter cavernicola]KAA0016309.1 zinc-binding dehydrogenase [Spelaeibacter cavernicola]